jgi:uncharacterized RDD family membrane protein YckC
MADSPSPRASWARRVFAQLTDLVAVLLLGAVVLAIAGATPYWHSEHLHGRELELRYLTAVFASFAYVAVTLAIHRGQTGGKFLFGLEVVQRDGRQISFGRAIWREVAIKVILLDGLALLPPVGGGLVLVLVIADALWPLWSVERFALHDYPAGTRVVRKSYRQLERPEGVTT